MPVCKNCTHTFNGLFCDQCGQQENNGRFTGKELAGDFIAQVFTFELPLLHTIQQLLTRPGRFCAEYIRGKRKPYTSPIQYFLIMAGLHLLVRVLTKFDPIANQYKAMGTKPPTDKAIQRGESVGHFISENLNNFFFILVFILAFFSWLFFRKSKFTYTENVVFAFYAAGTYTIFPTIAIFLSYIHPSLYYCLYLFTIVYLSWSLIDFHQPANRLLGTLKGVIASVLSYIAYILFASTVGMMYFHWIR
ncbi:DUF3667 domain-containing protein [Cytophagaceae bacterium DM2B3-1]|uniref:DUF3667 domain-containing protein n=1 Tax=Xanthocytophaga flava TaxID=3048013 RepID=A0ABT7CLI3_9BACT|nr:DUF3667 domain-containing protein [Xanthocytophaga flavus]MDJ1468214.1 DUF3667 domain-containing protein [Xanthocytophaga flavus]MDJ1494581.1 DUF3667 domain-containing protein [Xanthocytophaga flavus]